MSDVSLELAGGVKVLNPVPSDPRTKAATLAAIENNPTYYVGFTPIYNVDDGLTYRVSGGDATSGWEFEEAGGGGAETAILTPVAGISFNIGLSDPTQYTLTIPDGSTEVSISFSLPDDADEIRRQSSLILDNSGNSSAINLINFTGTWEWPVGEPQTGIAANSKVELIVYNIGSSVVKGGFI